MAENLVILQDASRKQQYENVLPQVAALVADEPNLYANMANVSAVLKEAFGFFWVGFYLTEGAEELVLGPFQGPVACTRIKKGKGVCGKCWELGTPVIVPDVDEFPGHIACSSLSKSEITIPVTKNGTVVGILDVDSEDLNDFDEVDEKYLLEIVELLSRSN